MEINATLIISAVSFIIFMIIMDAILYKPIMKIASDRDNFINGNINEANEASQKAKFILDNKSAKISDSHREARSSVVLGVEQAKINKSNLIQEASNSSKEKVKEGKTLILSDKDEAVSVLKNDAATLSKEISEKLLGQPLSDFEFKHDVVDEVINNA